MLLHVQSREERVMGEIVAFQRIGCPTVMKLVIRMTRGKKRIADEIRGAFGSFDRIVIDVDGEEHAYDADEVIRLLERFEVDR